MPWGGQLDSEHPIPWEAARHPRPRRSCRSRPHLWMQYRGQKATSGIKIGLGVAFINVKQGWTARGAASTLPAAWWGSSRIMPTSTHGNCALAPKLHGMARDLCVWYVYGEACGAWLRPKSCRAQLHLHLHAATTQMCGGKDPVLVMSTVPTLLDNGYIILWHPVRQPRVGACINCFCLEYICICNVLLWIERVSLWIFEGLSTQTRHPPTYLIDLHSQLCSLPLNSTTPSQSALIITSTTR